MTPSRATALSWQRPFDVIVFDLDDTLLDTSRLLIPNASREACEAMIKAGLNTNLQACLERRNELARLGKRRNIYTTLVKEFGVTEGARPDVVAKAGHEAFLNRAIEPTITLIPGVAEMLTALRKNYRLYLVTAGHKATQLEKIRITGAEALFDGVFVVDTNRREKKTLAFAKILKEIDHPAPRCLSVGNRVDSDVGEARALGWKGCWVRYGEHAEMTPEKDFEQPDFTIDHILELKEKCRL